MPDRELGLSDCCLFHHFPSKPMHPADLLKVPHSQAKHLYQKKWHLALCYLSPEGTKMAHLIAAPPMPGGHTLTPASFIHTGPRLNAVLLAGVHSRYKLRASLSRNLHPFKSQELSSHCQEVFSAFKQETAIRFNAGHNERQAFLLLYGEGR